MTDVNLVPLRSAVLCVNCQTISNTPGAACPACGDSGLLPLYNTRLLPKEGGAMIPRERMLQPIKIS